MDKFIGIKNYIVNEIPNYILPVLKFLQKYSSISFQIFFLLHLTNVSIIPLISIDKFDDVLMINREVYQNNEFLLIYGSLTTHILSGILVRLFRRIRSRFKYGTFKKQKKNKGFFKSFNNLQLTGYILIPIVLFHILKERISPILVDGDSSFVDINYIIFQLKEHKFRTISGLNLLSILSIYHIIKGSVKWFKLKWNPTLVNGLIYGFSTFSFLSLLRLQFSDFVGFSQSVKEKYELYLNVIPL
ncbi:Mcp1p ASCRUDRAFT_8041 [Ascoidea rubescens DSM 1968]|uniref:Mitochondrial adapter protein MCP1 transmembrane domain-containing protein n=1 Tax=Ascoidea rubescens DSM 1968 TaxID=1344418 RepID=A0A1D2VHL3_9ASCO|nr:hypothetical protein ASCRUDRAFT_8041 [Ascoidea rubescens DSM 1968]ODV61082.1 hypothetical protein ASCRUDRAFT_8041 [Ascoidea rubescens DSM 1968]